MLSLAVAGRRSQLTADLTSLRRWISGIRGIVALVQSGCSNSYKLSQPFPRVIKVIFVLIFNENMTVIKMRIWKFYSYICNRENSVLFNISNYYFYNHIKSIISLLNIITWGRTFVVQPLCPHVHFRVTRPPKWRAVPASTFPLHSVGEGSSSVGWDSSNFTLYVLGIIYSRFSCSGL